MMAQGHPLLPSQRARFLEVLSKTSNVSAAADAAGFARRTAYDHRASDPEFAAGWEEAMEKATDALEQAVRNRAIDGVIRYVTSKDGLVIGADGQPVTERHYSDNLARLLLEAHRSDKFRNRSTVEVSGGGMSEALDEARKQKR